MRLSALVPTVAGADPEILGVTSDSRAVKAGYLFAALPGAKLDGAAFVKDAIAKGAVAVLGNEAVRAAAGATALIVDRNPRQRLAQIAARFYGRQPATIVAVTGTNGKTSIASFVRQIWTRLGHKAASFGTVGVASPKGTQPLSHTTPDPVEIHRLLAGLVDEGVDHVAFEASSHGLAQYRVDGVKLKAAGFTNLTRDHLDYHETFEAYEQAKLRLFGDVLPPDGVAVINGDSPSAPSFERVVRARGQRLIRVGESGGELHIVKREPRGDGQHLSVTFAGRAYDVALPLAGAFQASNALIAAGLVLGLGADAGAVFDALGKLEGAAGRLEKVGVAASGVPVYVDYAHTPDAVETILRALRPHTAKKLWVVLGCGGDRDPGKRPLMGAAAKTLADRVIVTDDNPRTEDAAAIRRAVLQGAIGAQEIGDRAKAIEAAILGAERGDVVVIAGKGHETGQIVGREVRHFNDAEEARAVIARTKG
ncbi:MAG: UDP-N-acetylmuramoyl-L-alanyl-D-glutamate--2,6-diaminopimelate ligase [Alphaproteobacteria bacterium]|nr:UDP-N-acetylmuramoyl-L-alanyl-D-glutamate--2,6-diaminopimelate ligase [Alphaproteobacteria bacterium]